MVDVILSACLRHDPLWHLSILVVNSGIDTFKIDIKFDTLDEQKSHPVASLLSAESQKIEYYFPTSSYNTIGDKQCRGTLNVPYSNTGHLQWGYTVRFL